MTTTVSSNVPAPGSAVKPRIVEQIEFHGVTIEALPPNGDGKVWIVFRHLCEALDLHNGAQQEKLKAKAWATVRLIRTVGVATDGKEREVFCIDLDSLPMWLATIESSRVKPTVRPLLLRFQRECARVLRDHFFGARNVKAPPAPRQPKAAVYKPHLESAFAMLGMTQKADRPLPVRVEWLVAAAEQASGMDLTEARQRAIAAAKVFDGEVPLIDVNPWHAGQRTLRSGLATRLPELRKQHQLSQAQLARRAGVSTTTIQAAETGESGLLFETALALAHVLGCPVEQLVADAA